MVAILSIVVMHVVLLLAAILLTAKLMGELFERYLKMPGVLGELLGGIIIGPFALGSIFFTIPGIQIGSVILGEVTIGPLISGPIFDPTYGTSGPVSTVIYTLAQLGAVILLFMAGLETNPKKFLATGKLSTIVAIGGVALPFIFGYLVTILFVGKGNIPAALFMGAALTATSIGITARVLSDINKLDTDEGTIILVAAVIDDIIGIIILAIVVGMVKRGAIDFVEILRITVVAVVFWAVLFYVGFKYHDSFTRFFLYFKSKGAIISVALVLCFTVSFLAEFLGLAMIIGAFAIGIALAHTEVSDRLIEALQPIYYTLVPIFFVVMGMLVDIHAMGGVIIFGIIITTLAVVGKIVGCGLPVIIVNKSIKSGLRVGMGMTPRGEVALIVAGIAFVQGAITSELYGVAIMMTVITTFLAPIFLVRLFR